MHPEDQNRCIKKTVWKEQPYMEKVIVIKPMNVTRKVTVLRKESKMVPMTTFVNKIVQERKVVKTVVPRTITMTIMVDSTIRVPETRMKKHWRMEKRTEYQDVNRTITRVTLEQRNVTRDTIEYKTVEKKTQAVRMIK